MNKREFIKASTLGLAFATFSPFESLGFNITSTNSIKQALVLGGRGFIGPVIVEGLINAGYNVTLLNRGKTNAHLFSELPVIICDRETENKQGLKKIGNEHKNKYWDVVVDTWQNSPKAVSDFLEEFKGRFGHYHYISTISVYEKWDKKFIDESEPLNPLPIKPSTIHEEYRYAIRKTFAEEIIRENIDNYTIYRSSGMKDFRVTRPDDPDAQPFWPIRFSRGGEILVPDVKDHYVQFTDVRSLVHFIVHCAKTSTYGEFNVASYPTPFKDYVSGLIHATQTPKMLHWIDGDFLKMHDLHPHKIVPFWREEPVGAYHFSVQKAMAAGFIHRPIVEMIKDQLDGYKCRFPKDDVQFGTHWEDRTIKYYSMQKEREIIDKWLEANDKK